MDVKIAITGKGGSGKSTIAGALIRHLAHNGQRVVALDADPNPNLGISIGLPRDVVETMKPILNALVDSGHTHKDPQPAAEDLLVHYGVAASDDIVLVATGKIERCERGPVLLAPRLSPLAASPHEQLETTTTPVTPA